MAQNKHILLALHELNYMIHVVNAFADNNNLLSSDEMYSLELRGLKNVNKLLIFHPNKVQKGSLQLLLIT